MRFNWQTIPVHCRNLRLLSNIRRILILSLLISNVANANEICQKTHVHPMISESTPSSGTQVRSMVSAAGPRFVVAGSGRSLSQALELILKGALEEVAPGTPTDSIVQNAIAEARQFSDRLNSGSTRILDYQYSSHSSDRLGVILRSLPNRGWSIEVDTFRPLAKLEKKISAQASGVKIIPPAKMLEPVAGTFGGKGVSSVISFLLKFVDSNPKARQEFENAMEYNFNHLRHSAIANFLFQKIAPARRTNYGLDIFPLQRNASMPYLKNAVDLQLYLKRWNHLDPSEAADNKSLISKIKRELKAGSMESEAPLSFHEALEYPIQTSSGRTILVKVNIRCKFFVTGEQGTARFWIGDDEPHSPAVSFVIESPADRWDRVANASEINELSMAFKRALDRAQPSN